MAHVVPLPFHALASLDPLRSTRVPPTAVQALAVAQDTPESASSVVLSFGLPATDRAGTPVAAATPGVIDPAASAGAAPSRPAATSPAAAGASIRSRSPGARNGVLIELMSIPSTAPGDVDDNTPRPREISRKRKAGQGFAAVTLVIAVPASFLSFFIGQALLTSTHTGAALSEPNVLRAVIATALYVTLCGLFAFGLGAILRNTAGAITAAYGFLFLVPQLAKALPNTWYADVVRWLPGEDVIAEITSTGHQQISVNLFSPWGEFAVFGAYTAVLLIAGALLFRHRDA
jgi:hypothetical protein